MQEKLNTLLPAGLLLLIGTFTFFQFENPLGWAIIPLLIAVAWMLGSPARLLAGYWVWAAVAEYLYQLSGRNLIRYGDEALLGLIAVALLFDQALRRRRYPELRRLSYVMAALLVIFALSAVINRSTPMGAAVTLVQYFRPFVLGYMAYVFLPPSRLRTVSLFFASTLLLQFITNTSWLVGIPFLPNPGYYGDMDWAVGTMGNSLYVAYTACFGMILCLSLLLTFRQLRYAVVGLVLFVSFVYTNTVHAYVFLGVAVLILALIPAKQPLMQVAAALGVCTIFGALALLLHTLLPQLISLEHYTRRGRDLLEGRKMDSYVRHVTELPRDIPVFLVGAGPANLGCAMTDERAYLPAKYHGWGFAWQERLEQAGGSIISHTRTGFLSIWGDLGPIAFVLYWGMHVFVAVKVTLALRAGRYTDPWQRAFAITLAPLMVFYLMVAFMVDLVHVAFWGPLPWILTGAVWTPRTQESTTTAKEPVPAGVELTPAPST